MARIAFISRALAQPNYHGGCVYAHTLLKHLAHRGHSIHYLWLTGENSPMRLVRKRPRIGPPVEAFYMFGRWALGSLMVATSPWRKRPCGKQSFPDTPAPQIASLRENETAWATRMIRRIRPEVIMVDFTENLPILDQLTTEERSQTRTLVLTHNIVHQRTESYRSQGVQLDFAPLSREEEVALLERADILVGIQQAESKQLRDMLPHKRVINAPMPVELHPARREGIMPGRLLFVGGNTRHNTSGLRWFLQEVWPEIRTQMGTASVVACGGVCEGFRGESFPGVHFPGVVADLAHWYAEASAIIVPLVAGSGLKIKLIEGMSYQRAIISTPIGAQGLPEIEQGSIIPIASAPSDFAAAVLEQLNDESTNRQTVARQNEWVQKNMIPEAALKDLDAIIDQR